MLSETWRRFFVYTERAKNGTIFVRLIISLNINRVSKFFHYQNHETIFNQTVTIDPTKPKVCHYTTL